MIPEEVINQAKQVNICSYLQTLGYKRLNSWSRNARYENPIREEKESSFDVDEGQNLWFDRGIGKGGNIIQLVMQYRKCSFQQAVRELTAENSFFLRCHSPNHHAPRKAGVVVKKIKELEAVPLIKYLSERGISIRVAKKYLKEAYFTVNGNDKQQYALAFPNRHANDQSGYELRNRIWKSCIGKKYYSVIHGADHSGILLFEGFMDFLSYLTYYKLLEPPCPTIVLNSITLLNDDLINKLKPYIVYAFLDNDQAGTNALKKMETMGISFVDQRQLFKDYKDFNDFLVDFFSRWKNI